MIAHLIYMILLAEAGVVMAMIMLAAFVVFLILVVADKLAKHDTDRKDEGE